MLPAYARSQYQEMQVQTTPGRLVVMLYDGALRFLHLALDALRNGDHEAQGLNLGKAQDILCELLTTLDMSAGELSDGLRAVYCHCLQRLLIANAEDRADYIEEVTGIMAPLRDAWEEAERAVRAQECNDSATLLVGAGRR
jgi:flagellar protein FliS